jgi:hypothetical protein
VVTLAGYQYFLTNYVQIPVYALPLSSPVIQMTLNVALRIVDTDLIVAGSAWCPPSPPDTTLYDLAVYNLATDFLINYATDQPGQTYFADLRQNFGIFNFIPGVISASHDETTGETLLNPDFMKNFTLSDLQRLKTPYGLRYLQLAQDLGTIWGLS